VQQRLNYLNLVDMKKLHDEKNELMAKELEIAAKVTGEAYTDALGFQHSRRKPMFL
jgi:hypothetical protein